MQPQDAIAGNNKVGVPATDIYTLVLQNEVLFFPRTSRVAVKEKTCWVVPDYLKVQYLKRAGHVSAGMGYSIHNFYEPTLLIGYMYKQMKSKNGEAPVLTLKNSFTILGQNTSEIIAIKGGVSINVLFGETAFDNTTIYKRAGYYFQEQIYSMPFIGGEWFFSRKTVKSSLFVEISTVDSFLKDAINSEFVQFDEIWAFSLGITVYLH
jgi:hypothetical protein